MPISYRKFRTKSARNKFRKNQTRRQLKPHKKNWSRLWDMRRKQREQKGGASA